MKKLLIALITASISLTVLAKENITIIYSWSPSDVAANFYRALAEESNRQQDKYNFVVDAKPGAGGTVAAKYVSSNPGMILANSSALFIRPQFFPNESHNIADYRSIMPMCLAPMYIATSKYKTWNEVPKDQPTTIGMSGMGTTTHMVAEQIVKRYPNLTVIPFKSTSEALLSALSGQTDFAVVFFGDADSWAKNDNGGRKLYLLGMTGKQAVNGVQTLSSQGFSVLLTDMSAVQQLFVSTKFPEDKFKEIRSIFVKAAQSKLVRDANSADGCIPNNQLADKDLDSWFAFQNTHWKDVASGITIKK